MKDLHALAEAMWQMRREKAEIWQPLAQGVLDAFDLNRVPTACEKGYAALANSLLQQGKGEYEGARVFIEAAQNHFALCEAPIWQARCAMNSGFLHVNMEMVTEALMDWQRAYHLGKELDDREMVITSLYSIAIAHRVHLERYEDAISHFEQVLSLCLQSEPPFYLTGNVYSGLSKCYMSLGKVEEAQRFADLALFYARAYGDAKTIGWSLELCGNTAMQVGDLERAQQFCDENLELWMSIEDPYGLAVAYQDQGHLKQLQGKLDEAKDYIEMAISWAQRLNSVLLLEPLYRVQAEILEDLSRPEESLEAYKKYMQYREMSLKAVFNREMSRVSTELRVENYHLRHVELQGKIEALKAAQEALVKSEKMNALLGLVAGVAHEINTPLGNSMTLNSYVLQECEGLLKNVQRELATLEDTIEGLQVIYEAQERIEVGLKSVSEIVESFKRIAVRTQAVQPVEGNVFEFFDSWRLSLKQQYHAWADKIEIHCPKDLKAVFDTVETLKVLDELFLNALRHGYPGVEPHHRPSLIVIDVLETERLAFTFKDFGVGIEEHLLPHVFEPFVRAKNGPKNLGIGLHVLYNIIVYLFNGSIEIDSKPGEGTRVDVRF